MKQITILTTLLFFALMPMMAQNKAAKNENEKLQYIRDRYAAEQLHASQSKDPNIPNNYTTITRKENRAAAGQCNEQVELFYDEVYASDEEPYPSSYKLTYVRRSFNIAARQFYQELLYDVDGQPLFWFIRYDCWFADADDFNKAEIRFYYDNGKLLKAIYKVADENGKMKEVKDGTIFQEDLDGLCSSPLDNFQEFKELFDVYYNKYYNND